jgi:glycosyltransferase involved in cell wall biosynthesis
VQRATKNIGIIITDLGPGGAQRIASIQADYLYKQGYHVSLITLDKTDDLFPTNEKTLRIRLEQDDANELYSVIEKMGLDLVIDHLHWSEHHYSFFELLKKKEKKFIIFDHASYFYPLFFNHSVSMFPRRRLVYGLADAVACLTRHTCAIFRLELNNAVVMHNPLSYQSDKLSDLKDETIIAVGNWLRSEKRLWCVFKTFSLLLKLRPKAKLLLVGPYNSNVYDLCADYGIPSGTIEIVGTQESVENFYERSSVLLLTSEVEGFGLVLTEAAMHGVPRVIMEVPGLEDIVIDGVDGYVVQDADCQAAADKIGSLLANLPLRQAMGTAAKENTAQFRLETVGKRWEWLIHEVLNFDDSTRAIHFAEDCETMGVNKVSSHAIMKDFSRQLHTFTANTSKRIPFDNKIRLVLQNYQKSLYNEPIGKLLLFPSRQWHTLKNSITAKRINESGLFDQSWYLRQNSDVADAHKNPLMHYLNFGVWEGRSPCEGFNPWDYLLRNPDVAASGLEPFYHYVKHGQFEGRLSGNLIRNRKAKERQAPFPADNGVSSLDAWSERYLTHFKEKDAEVVILHPDWRGICASSRQFARHEQCLFLNDGFCESEAENIAGVLSESGIRRVLFQGFSSTWERLAESLNKTPNKMEFYCIFHGSFYQMGLDYDRRMLITILNLQKKGVFKRIGFAKHGMAETMRHAGYDTAFVMNYVALVPEGPAFHPTDTPLKIGIWGREYDNTKPPYPSIAACSHISNVTPVIYGGQRASYELLETLNLKGIVTKSVPQNEMTSVLGRMYINMNVSMSECAPMLPLESLSAGVPCLFSHNNHYFDDHPYLHETLIVSQPDSEYAIMKKLRAAIPQRDAIVDAYIKYAPSYNARAKHSYTEFLNGEGHG